MTEGIEKSILEAKRALLLAELAIAEADEQLAGETTHKAISDKQKAKVRLIQLHNQLAYLESLIAECRELSAALPRVP